MMYCVDEIKEDLMVYKTYEDLYHRKFKASTCILKFTYMPPHWNPQSPRNIGSPTTSQLGPSFKFEIVKKPIPTPTKLWWVHALKTLNYLQNITL
jgi:hypothetical protein